MSQAYYSEADIDSFTSQVTANQDDYAQNFARAMASLLSRNPAVYKRYGVYWWGLKTLLNKYIQDGGWYCSPKCDHVMQVRADHGSEFRNALAAAVYYANHPLEDSQSQWEDYAGVIHPYTLVDVEAPQ